MKFTVQREALLKTLTLVTGVVERRQTMPILANVLLDVDGDKLSMTGTDTEIEISGHLFLAEAAESPGSITVPAKKLLDICKSLPEGSMIRFVLNDNQKMQVNAGRSRFSLTTLPANEFPNVEEGQSQASFSVLQGQLKRLIDRTAFAMAQQDVRFYLNGMLWEVTNQRLRVVSTDGHRLAMCDLVSDAIHSDNKQNIIVPRKGIHELARSLTQDEEPIRISIGDNHLTAKTDDFTFITKLIDGKFPDYERVLPSAGSKIIIGSRMGLREAFNRASILSNEKYRGVKLELASGSLTIRANNPEQEEAEDSVEVDYQGDALEIGFNVSYLIDVTNVLTDDMIKISLSDGNSSALIEEATDSDSIYVVMPMRL